MSERFRMNYKDEIATKTYQIVDADTGAIISKKVKLNPNYKPTQVGDKFGATEVNAIHSRLNELADVDKVERGTFGVQIDGAYFPIQYTKVGKLVELEIDVTLGILKGSNYELTTSMPFDVYSASGACMLQVSTQIVGYGRIIGTGKRLVVNVSNGYGAPVTIQGSVICAIK